MKHSIAKYSNSTMTLGLLAIFVAMVAISSGYPAGARFMTFVVGLPAIALCLLQLALDARERGRSSDAAGPPHEFGSAPAQQPHSTEAALDPRTRLRRELVVWGYFLALIGSILLFGFYATIPVFMVSFLRFQAKAKWLTALGLAAAASLVVYLAFENVLRVSLHPGFLTEHIRTFLML